MDPGDYMTNVLSSNTFTTIHYEFYEAQSLSLSTARRALQKLEAAWRQEGRFVHCDPNRDGIWIFRPHSSSLSTSANGIDIPSTVEGQGISLVVRDTGTYEPASLARAKPLATSSGTPTTNPSPSSSLENALKNAQTLNARAVLHNSSHGPPSDPLTSIPGLSSITIATVSSVSLEDLHEYLISSILGSLVFQLCRNSGYIPLNCRTLIVPPLGGLQLNSSLSVGYSDDIGLATLDISITSLGTLIIKAHTDKAPGLCNLVHARKQGDTEEQLQPGSALWLAPGGAAARFSEHWDEKALAESSTPLQSTAIDGRPTPIDTGTLRTWQSSCLEWMSTRGLNPAVLDIGGWVLVQMVGGRSPYSGLESNGLPLLGDTTIIPWPALLCFRTSSIANDLRDNGVNGSEYDPLSFAELWLQEKDERANTFSRRQNERNSAEALLKEQTDIEARILQNHTFSPIALRRSSNAGAMYPTPPDALQHPIGTTPSFDGAGSTPSNQNMFPGNDVGAMGPAQVVTQDMESEMWGTSDQKDRTTSHAPFNDNDNDNDNLFGDVGGGDMFGTDITDADFNFFDEPDTSPGLDLGPSPTAPGISSIVAEQTGGRDELLFDDNSIMKNEALDVVMKDEDSPTRLDQENHAAASILGDEVVTATPMPHPTDLSEATMIPSSSSAHPPFSKEAVFKRLLNEPKVAAAKDVRRRASTFNKVDFEKSVASVNQKYGPHGQFHFSSASRKPSMSRGTPGLPKTEFLSSRRRLQELKRQVTFSRLLSETVISPIKAADPMDFLTGSDTSQISEQDDTSPSTDGLYMLNDLRTANEWQVEYGEGFGGVSPFDAMSMDIEHTLATPKSAYGPHMPLLDIDPADWSLTTYLTSIEPDASVNTLSDYERIATAQILADQAVTGRLRLPTKLEDESSTRPDILSTTRELMHDVTKTARTCLGDITICSLRDFVDIQGIPVLNQTLRLPPRPVAPARVSSMTDALKANSLFTIPPPQLELRRSDAKLALLPSAVNFWENLGLSPAMGVKDISAVCIYPKLPGVETFADTFLDQMRSVYESARLGTHDRIISKELTQGLLPYVIDIASQNKNDQLSQLRETAGRLSRILGGAPVEDKNLVVYFVYPEDDPAVLIHICSAFQHLFNTYRKILIERKLDIVNELVLQLVPLDFIASPTSMVVHTPAEYARLAMEVYDRCVDFSSSSSPPAIMLEQPLPRNIDFKLSVDPSASLLQENTCLHIAYAQSLDDRWITAAWTDNRGTQQMTASYCLGRKNEPISMPFSHVANEIWETTLDYVSSKKIHWRIIIARAGVMDPSEMEFWMGLAATETADTRLSLTLVTVQANSSLRLLPDSVSLLPSSNHLQSTVTPISTPQPSQNSAAATPGDPPSEPDSDARLLDYTDQTWGVILSHRLNNSNSLVEINPALISGYLMKRGGTNVDDPPILIEVNIIHSEVVGNPRTFHESLLREILGYYRGLGTIARIRGIVDPRTDGRPWHIAAAEKAVNALYILM